MRKDGRSSFFRQMSLDKKDMQLISAFIEVKNEMMKEDTDAYNNGKQYTK